MKAWVGLALALAACSGSSSTGSQGGADGATSSGSSSGGSTDGGGTTITGSVGGTTFNNAATALWIGAPDSAQTTVVYVFSNPVQCSDLSSAGWDSRIMNKTQILEMKMFGTTPQMYKVVTTATPAPGEASVNYTLSSTSGTPMETASSGGTVTLTALNGMTDAIGSFALQFGTDMLNGTFDAAYCPGGREP